MNHACNLRGKNNLSLLIIHRKRYLAELDITPKTEQRTETTRCKKRMEGRQCSSRKLSGLMAHNKCLSVLKLVMSIRASLISFVAFNKYVAAAIRHNFARVCVSA